MSAATKPLPYLPLPREDNPFLGERGIRVLLNRPELLRAQLRAILGASREGQRLGHVSDDRHARRVAGGARDSRRGAAAARRAAESRPGSWSRSPSAALMADQFAREVDFFSIGTNDLTQYTLAMDRGHPRLAPQVDGLSPAVLRLIDMAVRAAAHARPLDRRLRRHCRRPASSAAARRPRPRRTERERARDPCRQGADSAAADGAIAARSPTRPSTCATAAEVRALVPLDAPS